MENPQEEFNPPRKKGPISWIKWLFLIVGCFIVCLMIWIFMEMNKDAAEAQENAMNNINTEQIQNQ